MLGFLEKMCRLQGEPEDMTALRAAGISDKAIEDAIYVCAAFNAIVRLADTLEFAIPDDAGFQASAQNLLRRGYNI